MSRERELEQRIRRLEEINDQNERLLGAISHELRNPLAAIRSAAEVLRLTLGAEPRVQKTYAILERQTSMMVKLLDRLSDISKIARGKITLDLARIDLGQLLTRTLADKTAQIEAAQLTLESSVPLDELWVKGDSVRLGQIFDQLLSNAIRFSTPRNSIQVTAQKKEHDAVVIFEDAGAGIEATLLPHLFDVFEPSASGKPRLGLALVRGLIELHGGTVVARSNGPGRGAQFELRVPLAQ